jgi:catechol 2,3-dioxygenase-like lactoylglutathione lyase family enzyme
MDFRDQGNEVGMKALEFRFAFFAHDFDRSVGFYRDIMGFEYLSGWDRPDGQGALFRASGQGVIEIYGAVAGQRYMGPRPVAINLALRVAGPAEVDAAYEDLKAKQMAIQEAPTDKPWGHRSFVLLDPDGIPIHIYCDI